MRSLLISSVLLAGVALGACGGQPTLTVRKADLPQKSQDKLDDYKVKSDLHNALTAEMVLYTDEQKYSTSAPVMMEIAPDLDWSKIEVSVGDAVSKGDGMVVCITESSATGKTFSIADVGRGAESGRYFGPSPCPAHVTAAAVAALGDINNSDT